MQLGGVSRVLFPELQLGSHKVLGNNLPISLVLKVKGANRTLVLVKSKQWVWGHVHADHKVAPNYQGLDLVCMDRICSQVAKRLRSQAFYSPRMLSM